MKGWYLKEKAFARKLIQSILVNYTELFFCKYLRFISSELLLIIGVIW